MSRLYELYLSINDFEILAEFNVLQNLHIVAQKSVCNTNLGPFGEIGAIFSLQLSSRTRFDKVNKKKVIAENQCEKHKNRVNTGHIQGTESRMGGKRDFALCLETNSIYTVLLSTPARLRFVSLDLRRDRVWGNLQQMHNFFIQLYLQTNTCT